MAVPAFKSPFLPDNPQLFSAQEGYDLWSELYDEEVNVLILLEERYLLPMLAERQYQQILDCGCGTGRMSLWLANQYKGAKITALDFSEGMLTKARKKDAQGQIDWQVADLNVPFPLADESFDLITSTLVVEHIDNLKNYFSEMLRVARPGADIFVTGLHPAMHLFGISARFKDPQTKNDIMPKSHCYDISEIFNCAQESGLKIERMLEYYVDRELIDQAPKAGRYEGMPLLLIMKMTK